MAKGAIWRSFLTAFCLKRVIRYITETLPTPKPLRCENLERMICSSGHLI
jgi:hypothetical protein